MSYCLNSTFPYEIKADMARRKREKEKRSGVEKKKEKQGEITVGVWRLLKVATVSRVHSFTYSAQRKSRSCRFISRADMFGLIKQTTEFLIPS